jgi:type VI secretion system secreted protein Hcp
MACDNFLWFPDEAKGGTVAKAGGKKPEGESTDDKLGATSSYKALEILSFNFGVAQAETTGSGTTGSGAGKAKFEEFTIEKYIDKASLPLYVACATGAHFPNVLLAIRKSGGESLLYLQYIFRQVFVTNITWNGGGGEEMPKETVKFKFAAMGVQYVQQKADGTAGTKMVGSWSQATNQPNLNVTSDLTAAKDFIAESQAS